MEEYMIFDKVKEILVKQLHIDESKITLDSKLVEDLKADSANVMLLIIEMENAFDIEVDDGAILTLKTVGDVVKYIENSVEE